MAIDNVKTHNQEFIDNLKYAAESIIKNAESIVGTETYLDSVSVSIDLNWHEVPTVNVSRDFIPEEFIEAHT